MLCHFSVLVMETAYTGKFLEGEGGGGKRKREREREEETGRKILLHCGVIMYLVILYCM